MGEEGISSDSELAPLVLEVPNIYWADYIGMKDVQRIKMGHVSKILSIESNNWDLEDTVRETKGEFATDLQILMTETTNDSKLLSTLECLETQQYNNAPKNIQRKLSKRYELLFYEETFVVPIDVITTIITFSQKGHWATNKNDPM